MKKEAIENYKIVRLDAEAIESVALLTKELKEKTGKFYSRETFINTLIKRFANLNKEKFLLEYKEELLKQVNAVKLD